MHYLNCILLRLYIYVSPLTEHAHQRRFQCKQPKKKVVSRELTSPVAHQLLWKSVLQGGWLQNAWTLMAKARFVAMEVLARVTKRSCRSSEPIADEDKWKLDR